MEITQCPWGKLGVLVIVVKMLPDSQITTAPPPSPLGSLPFPCDCGNRASRFASHNGPRRQAHWGSHAEPCDCGKDASQFASHNAIGAGQQINHDRIGAIFLRFSVIVSSDVTQARPPKVILPASLNPHSTTPRNVFGKKFLPQARLHTPQELPEFSSGPIF